MKIAMLAPISWRTPPRHYGPWELVTSLLTEALVRKGADVTLFATQDSLTAGKLDGVVPAAYSEEPAIDAKVWEHRHLSHLFAQADRFDVIHNQADFPAHAFAPLVSTPMVTTKQRCARRWSPCSTVSGACRAWWPMAATWAR